MMRCTPREFLEWQAYYSLNPWGEERADLRSGIIASILANVHSRKSSKHYKPKDFLLTTMPKQRQTVRQIWSGLKSFAMMHNASIGKSDRA